jgi:hypothetical protein
MVLFNKKCHLFMCMSRCSIPEEAVADEPGSDMTDGAERVSDAPAEPVGREEVAPCYCTNGSMSQLRKMNMSAFAFQSQVM